MNRDLPDCIRKPTKAPKTFGILSGSIGFRPRFSAFDGFAGPRGRQKLPRAYLDKLMDMRGLTVVPQGVVELQENPAWGRGFGRESSAVSGGLYSTSSRPL